MRAVYLNPADRASRNCHAPGQAGRIGSTAGDPFPATASLGFAGFFFPLLQPVFGMGGHPAIR